MSTGVSNMALCGMVNRQPQNQNQILALREKEREKVM